MRDSCRVAVVIIAAVVIILLFASGCAPSGPTEIRIVEDPVDRFYDRYDERKDRFQDWQGCVRDRPINDRSCGAPPPVPRLSP